MFKLANKFPPHEKYKLTDQLIRSSRSVTANIAEGFGRFHYQEYVQFCRQSRGSLFEVLDHLTVAYDSEYITESQFVEYEREIENCLPVLNGFINYLLRAKADLVNEPDMPYSGYEPSERTPAIND